MYQFGRNPRTFTLRNRCLKIDRCKQSSRQNKASTVDPSPDSDMSNIVSFKISNIHYGTFIKGAAMNNITGTDRADDFGLIAHRLINSEHNIRISLRINFLERKFSFVISHESLDMWGSSTSLTFEWAFGAYVS